MRRVELHENERPLSLLISQGAEINRDSNRRKKPYSMEDFYLYADFEDGRNGPRAKYGAAAMELIKKSLFPSWALFIYKDLKIQAGNAIAPDLLAFIHENALILAPSVSSNECAGMLIATEEASGKTLTMESPCGKSIRVLMPDIRAKVYAEEDCIMTAFL
jgi:hypothetical protein